MTINILGSIKHIKTFENIEDFNKYYSKHKEEIDSKTTNQLNKEYTIKGYKITKRNMRIVDGKKIGDLFIKAINEDSNKDINEINDINNQIEDLYTKISQLNDLYKQLANVVNELIN